MDFCSQDMEPAEQAHAQGTHKNESYNVERLIKV